MIRNALIAAACVAAIAPPGSARAQVNQHGYSVPFDLANTAAQEALRACTANGYAVTVTFVDVSGVPQVILRGDHSTIHTRDSSFRKAYTVVTVGPLFKQETSGAFAEAVQKNPAAAQLATLPNMIALPGLWLSWPMAKSLAGWVWPARPVATRTKLAHRPVSRKSRISCLSTRCRSRA